MRSTLEALLEGKDLDEGQARRLLDSLTEPDVDPVMAGAVLTALRVKGETASELRGFAMGLRERAIRPSVTGSETAVDIVGTGGDGSGSLNLSTGAALLAAACGQIVIKHGNRSVSSQCGSADVLAAFGLEIPLEEGQIAALLDQSSFTFLFAPSHHPAMKTVAPVRKALGVRTIFNLVGPLANPATPGYLLLGASSLAIARVIAEALSGMPVQRAVVVHGSPGWDEPTPVGPYHLIEVQLGETREYIEDPLDFGIPRCEPADLAGGDASHNAWRLRTAFEGERGPHRDALVLGASLAMRVTGKVGDLRDAITQAETAIDEGRALGVLEILSSFHATERAGVV